MCGDPGGKGTLLCSPSHLSPVNSTYCAKVRCRINFAVFWVAAWNTRARSGCAADGSFRPGPPNSKSWATESVGLNDQEKPLRYYVGRRLRSRRACGLWGTELTQSGIAKRDLQKKEHRRVGSKGFYEEHSEEIRERQQPNATTTKTKVKNTRASAALVRRTRKTSEWQKEW